MAFTQKLHANVPRLVTPPKAPSGTQDWRSCDRERVLAGATGKQTVPVVHEAAYAVPTSFAAMSLSPGLYLPPPPPPRSPGSAGSGSFPHRRVPPAHPSFIQTALGGAASGQQPERGIGGSPYSYSPAPSHTPLSPYASAAFSPLSQGSSTANSPMALRPQSGNTMVAEYNPQQWGRGGQPGVQFRPFNTTTLNVASRALDENGAPLDSPPPPYSPPPNQSINQTLRPPSNLNPARSPPALQTSLSGTAASIGDYASPASAITVISPMSGRNRNEPPPPLSFPPPPGSNTRDRSASRSRPDGRSRFGLSALTSRGKSIERSSSGNAIDTLQQGTNEALSRGPGAWGSPSPQTQPRQVTNNANRYSVYNPPAEIPPAPPAARRSASAGALSGNGYAPPPPWAQGSSQLPGPPPGPPPGSSRAASMSRASSSDSLASSHVASANSNDVPIIALPTRRPHHRGTQLGPVPPTPANWTEFPESPMPPQMRKPSVGPHPLSIETGNHGSSSSGPELVRSSVASSSSSGKSTKPIRVRRSESRAARERNGELSAVEPSPGYNPFVQSPESIEAKPANLVLTSPNSGNISRQSAVKKARASPVDTRNGPRLPTSINDSLRADHSSTPPFSPENERKDPFPRPSAIPPKALPTPPPNSTFHHDFTSPSGSLGVRSPSERPISHILHTPNNADMDTKSPPMIPQKATPSPLNSSLRLSASNQSESFAESAIERHRQFIVWESQAGSDTERLELFAEYMVAESRIRRDRYSQAFAAMEASDIIDLTHDMWRSQLASPATQKTPRSARQASLPSPPPGPSRTDSMDSFASMSSPPSSAATNFTPRTEGESPSSAGSTRDVGAAWARHQPVLSPIPSMAMSTVPDPDEDEQESRGRAPSRWWESSAGSTGAGHRIERSKRESKYMGLQPQALANLQWQDEPSPSLHSANLTPRTMGQFTGEYPPEKVGWHEEEGAGPASTPSYMRPSVPSTPDPHKLDVSRLVTLPPPYPRHYPAMHNNHPELDTLRTTLDLLRDLNEITEPKETFRAKMAQRRERQAQEATDRHAEMRHNIQDQLHLGQMTYAEAAAAEENFSMDEARSAHEFVQQEFNAFQPEVMTPLHALLSERITKATACITQLKSGLTNSADNPSPNQPQEEGDEQPELLEKLNLLKWLFEARETLNKELFELEGEKNERFRELIILPLRNVGDEAKIQDAETFFDSDRRERKLAFEKSTLKRFEQFAKIVEENVTRGVEDQLSAFWDIAPGLLAIVQKVPADMLDFDIQIPGTEYDENPQYHDFPLQYLYSLLMHAEKSAYQFIESQVNLMCLLHEAHSGVMVAGIRLLETQRCGEGEDWKDVTREMGDCRRAEEQRLTAELKDKVETVESQWREALGSGLDGVKERVEGFLVEIGGWDEALLE